MIWDDRYHNIWLDLGFVWSLIMNVIFSYILLLACNASSMKMPDHQFDSTFTWCDMSCQWMFYIIKVNAELGMERGKEVGRVYIYIQYYYIPHFHKLWYLKLLRTHHLYHLMSLWVSIKALLKFDECTLIKLQICVRI